MSNPIPPFDELPELTLSLRSFGSRRRLPNDTGARQDDQERFFGPLLEGRRAASSAVTRAEVVAAFDGQRVTALIDSELRAFASERFATRAPARRAFEAELFEIVEPLHDALLVLRSLGEMLTIGQDSAAHGEQWMLWLAQLRVVFRIADSSWPPLCDALQSSPQPTPTRWRRDPHGEERR
jgi:hypothetical protein